MTDWTAPARDIRPGDRYRWLGTGYRARTVTTVAHMCNCQNPAGGSVHPDGTPQAVPASHRATFRGGIKPALHYPVVIVSSPDLTVTIGPHWQVTMTDGGA